MKSGGSLAASGARPMGATTRPRRCCSARCFRGSSTLRRSGLGYLALDRSTRTLSGGEVERVNLTTCLGASLVNTLFVLDEPSIGLHARDTNRLIRVMEQLRDKGNTLLVVEHDEAVIRAADHLIELGPGRGEEGGELVFDGPLSALLGRNGNGRPETGKTGKRKRPAAARATNSMRARQ